MDPLFDNITKLPGLGALLWLIYRELKMRNNNKSSNPNNNKPGKAQKCIEHGEAIARVETEVLNIKDSISAIFRKIG